MALEFPVVAVLSFVSAANRTEKKILYNARCETIALPELGLLPMTGDPEADIYTIFFTAFEFFKIQLFSTLFSIITLDNHRPEEETLVSRQILI